jgi:hypothetical protein
MKPTAYTIGNRIGYDRDLASLPVVTKIGRDEDYPGGWVWRTAAEAQQFIDATDLSFPAKVYGLVLPNGWEQDVSAEPGDDGVHNLLNDARIIQL